MAENEIETDFKQWIFAILFSFHVPLNQKNKMSVMCKYHSSVIDNLVIAICCTLILMC